jgi:hypothetical protein
MSDCSICLEKILEHNVYVTNCGHKFHKSCSEQLKENGHYKCPMCRKVMFDHSSNIDENTATSYENFRETIRNVSNNTEENRNVIRNLLSDFNQVEENQ